VIWARMGATSVAAGAPRRSQRLHDGLWFGAAALSLTGLYVWSYGDCLHAFFCYDDFWVLAAAAHIHIHSPLDIVQFFMPDIGFLLYRPLSTRVYFYLLKHVAGYDPTGYHAVQILFSILNALLVYQIAKRLLGPTVALGVALIYATAPGHAISACDNALFTETGTAFWYLLALWAWLALAGLWRVSVTVSCFVLALLASEHGITLPVVITLATLLLEPDGGWRRIARQQWPLYLIAAAYAGVKLYYLHYILPKTLTIASVAYALAYQLKLEPQFILRHLGQYVGFAFDVAYSPLQSDTYSLAVGAAFLLLAVVATACVLTQRWTAPPLRMAAFGLGLFIITLGPVLALATRVGSYYVGLPAFGLALALVGFVRRLPRARGIALSIVVATMLAVHVFATATLVRSSDEFHFFFGFSRAATRWLYTLSLFTGPPGTPQLVREVIVPATPVTNRVFTEGEAHKLFLCARYPVQASNAIDAVKPLGGRLILHEPLPLPVARANRWDWLRAACP